MKKGQNLSISDAQQLETRLNTRPDDADARIELLAWYTLNPALDAGARRAGRARHILWIIEHDPKTGFGLINSSSGIYHIHCRGDELADPQIYAPAVQEWLEQAQKYRTDPSIGTRAAAELEYCAPEKSEELLRGAGDKYSLGALYARAVLGVTGVSYTSTDAQGSDAALRGAEFAQRALQSLESATDRDLLLGAATVLLRTGAQLWADGKMDWDYTPLGKKLVEKARQAGAPELMLMTLPAELPAPGERPPLTLRIGGAVQQKNLRKQIAPQYPPEARARGLEGTVRMMALIGTDGKVMALQVLGGPAELVPPSLAAVHQWEYKPTLLNGKPVYVITTIDVNYALR